MGTTLTGRTALVTGAGRGIGRAIALALAQEGASLVLVARSADQIESVATEIKAAGGRAIAVRADVGKQSDVEASVAAGVKAFGPIDILINNAGGNVLGKIDEMDPAAWWEQVEINLRGPYFYCRSVIPSMVERKWGRIVNMSSTQGKIGTKYATAYCSAKHGIIGLTRALAVEVADKGVTVNAVCPGYVRTALTDSTTQQRAGLSGVPLEKVEKAILDRQPQRSFMVPEDIVPSVMFLVSDGGVRTTGEAVNVSGGSVMH